MNMRLVLYALCVILCSWMVGRDPVVQSASAPDEAPGTTSDEQGSEPIQRLSLSRPAGLALDLGGNLYVADTGHHRVLLVENPTGRRPRLLVIAGTGAPGFGGDGGPATAAELNRPTGLVVDPRGNVYIADTGNNRIRLVDRQGVIRTVAGNRLARFCGDGGPAPRACLRQPTGVALDGAGNLYIADAGNNVIRRVAAGSDHAVTGDDALEIISTVAGNGLPTFCGDGQRATDACLNMPTDVVIDLTGALFIADKNNDRVRRVVDELIETVIGGAQRGLCGDGGPALRACLFLPAGLAIRTRPSPALFIADVLNHRIRQVTPDGLITTVAGSGPVGPGQGGFSGDGGPALRARLNEPFDVVADTAGNVFIADTGNNRIRWVDAQGIIRTLIGP